MNWTFILKDKTGNDITGETFLDGVSQGAFNGTDTLSLDNDQHEIIFVPDQILFDGEWIDAFNTYTNIIPAGWGDSINDLESILIIFQAVDDFEPICQFEILKLTCSSDVLVLYTVAPSASVNLTWNFGDGTPSELVTVFYLVHKYQTFGDFVINLNVEICHNEVQVDEDGCPCRNTSIYTENPIAEEITVVGDVHTYQVSIDYFYRGNCCQDAKILLTIYVNGTDEGTSYGGLTLITTAIDENDNVISFSNDLSVITPPNDTQFVVKGISDNTACNNFAIPLIFDFSNFDGTL